MILIILYKYIYLNFIEKNIYKIFNQFKSISKILLKLKSVILSNHLNINTYF